MTTVIPEPFVLDDALLTIDVDEYAAAVSNVTITPRTSTKTFKGLTPAAKFTRVVVEGWDAQITLAQDWENADSLANYLFDPANEGKVKPARFEPQKGGTGFTANLVIVPPSIGGAGGDFTTSQVSLGVDGRPVKVAPAPVDPEG